MKQKSLFIYFIIAWFMLNMVQAYFSGLFNDEAYYYFYSEQPAWGYYDHPPLVALFIRIGYSIFHNELGARLLFILSSVGTLLLVRKLSETKNDKLFAVLFLSFLIFQITGFMAFPDSLLLFFTALFFLVYRNYTESYSYRDAIMLGMVMAGMFYSKYLGIFIVFLTVLSQPRLLIRRSFWLAVAVTSLLFLPHLLWQYRHDFPSFYYHMLERSHDESFRWTNFLDYIAGQFLQSNPFLFIPLIILVFRFRPENMFERSLKFAAIGLLILPFLLMIRGRVEANWTMAGMIPLFIIAVRMFDKRPSYHRFIYFSGAVTVLLILLARTVLIHNFIPEGYRKKIKLDNYGWKVFSEKVEKLAQDRPVVFIGSYQNPSQYNFYTGKTAFSFNNALYRNNQYDLTHIEQQLQGREVMIITPGNNISTADIREYGLENVDSLQYPNGKFRLFLYTPDYHSYNYIDADFLLDDFTFNAGDSADIPVILKNPATKPVNFSEAAPWKVSLCIYILQKGRPVVYHIVRDLSDVVFRDDYPTSIRIRIPSKPGTYYMKLSIKSGWLPPGINSRLHKIIVR